MDVYGEEGKTSANAKSDYLCCQSAGGLLASCGCERNEAG